VKPPALPVDLVRSGAQTSQHGLGHCQGYFALAREDVLGAGAAYGRTFTAADEGAAPTMVLSHALWQRRFGEAPRG